ncbi:MAG: hypothetical protein ACREUV_01860 [Burkholderiales bacterium]
MSKSVRMAALAAAMVSSLALVSPVRADQPNDIEHLWGASGYSQPGKAMRTMKMMKMIDANSDHKVTKAEFMKYYEMVFDKMDAKHLGEIGVNEWLGH